jgi:hypothetical protein
MAYGYANVSATELANLAVNKPLVGVNMIPVEPTTEKWGRTGTTGDTDYVDSDYPILRLYDGEADLISQPDSAFTSYYVIFDFGTTVDVDFCAIGPGHNLGTSAITGLALEFDQNQNGSFSAVDSCDLSASLPLSDDSRIMQLDLDPGGGVGTPQRFSDVRYCRLKMTKGSSFTPQLTEVIIGARLQMPRWTGYGFNPDNLTDLVEIGEPTKGGVVDQVIMAKNQFVLDAEWTLKQSEVSDVKTWWKNSRGSFVWCWQPSSTPNSWHLMSREDSSLSLPREGFQKAKFRISAVEQGPEGAYLENE